MRRIAGVAALAMLMSSCFLRGEVRKPAATGSPTATKTSLRDLVTPGTPRWRTLRDAPTARQEVAAAAMGERIYVIGGLLGSGVTSAVEVYDTRADRWTSAPPLPQRIHHATAVAYGNHVVVIGGFDERSRPIPNVWVLANNRWVPGPPLKRGRAAAAAVVHGDSIVVLGGQGAGALVSPVELFTPRVSPGCTLCGVWTDAANIPTPRHHVAAAYDGTWIYVSGGRRPAPNGQGPDQNVATFERYAPSTNKWEQLFPLPTRRSGHGSGFIAGKVIVVGGEDPTVAGSPSISRTEEYNPQSASWSRTFPGMFRARHGVGAITMGNRLYVLVGATRAGVSATSLADALVVP